MLGSYSVDLWTRWPGCAVSRLCRHAPMDRAGNVRAPGELPRGVLARPLSDFLGDYFDLFNTFGLTLRSSQARSKMSFYEVTYVFMTIITFMMVLSCLIHLDGDL